jgi:hypothetical protein
MAPSARPLLKLRAPPAPPYTKFLYPAAASRIASLCRLRHPGEDATEGRETMLDALAILALLAATAAAIGYAHLCERL